MKYVKRLFKASFKKHTGQNPDFRLSPLGPTEPLVWQAWNLWLTLYEV